MDAFQALGCFIRVVELRSFTGVARETGMSQPSVSKTIARLERHLGVRLIERTTTNLTLTDEGRRFYARSLAVVEAYSEAVADAQGHLNRPVGKLVIAAPLGLGELRLNALFLDFLATFPDVELEVILNDRVIDLVEEGVDLAIRLGDVLPPNVVARRLATSPRVLVAAPGYVERHGALQTPEDLSHHAYLRFAGIAALGRLEFSRQGQTVIVEPKGRYSVNSSMALRDCFRGGAGLGSAPAWLVEDLIDNGSLTRLLADWVLPSQSLQLVYPSRRYLPQRTRALIQFLSERLPQLPGFVNAVKEDHAQPNLRQVGGV